MALLSDIINAAYRESGITAVGASPTAAEQAEALTILINLISSVYQEEVGEFLVSYNVGSNGVTYGPSDDYVVDTIIPENARLKCNLSAPTTLYLPARPHDGSLLQIQDIAGNFATYNLTLNPNGRKINGGVASVVLNTNGYNTSWIFTENSGWNSIGTLSAASDTFPFDALYTDLFSILLAMRLNPRYGADTPPTALDTVRRMKRRFSAQYKHTQEVASEDGLLYIPSRRFRRLANFAKGA